MQVSEQFKEEQAFGIAQLKRIPLVALSDGRMAALFYALEVLENLSFIPVKPEVQAVLNCEAELYKLDGVALPYPWHTIPRK